MTSDSNNNLLKILLNRPANDPEGSSGYFELFQDNPNLINTYKITYDQLQYNGYTVGLDGTLGTNGGYLMLYDNNGNLLMRKRPVSNGVTYNVVTIDMDKEGNLYGIIDYDYNTYLAYFNNIFVADTEGNYDVKIKKSYKLNSMITAIYNDLGENVTLFNLDIKKSPINSSFLITWAYYKGSHPYTLISILYHVNFEGENNYEYKSVSVGSYGYNWIKNVEPTWTESGVSFTDVILSTNYDASNSKGAAFYKVTGNVGIDNTSISSTLMLSETAYVDTEYKVDSDTDTIISKNAVQKGDYIYFASNSLVESTLTTTIYCYDTELKAIWNFTGNKVGAFHNMINMTKVNNECFAWGDAFYSSGEVLDNAYFFHLLDDECIAYEMTPEGINGITGAVCLIQNSYNLYDIIMSSFDITVSKPHAILIYRANGYNGDPYYNDESVTPAYSTLYTYYQSWYDSSYSANMPIFSRDLYNSYKLGNTITSVVQIPYNYLNDTTINQTDILSRTANVINENIQPIDKNMYEELYINNQNSYRVYDNNVGSTYNQEATLKVVDNIFNGFTGNYKITKFRINYNDNTYANKDITHIDITNNIGVITMYIYLTKKAKNIQLYDDSFSAPFVTIDISNCDTEKIYQIVQKIKVE